MYRMVRTSKTTTTPKETTAKKTVAKKATKVDAPVETPAPVVEAAPANEVVQEVSSTEQKMSEFSAKLQQLSSIFSSLKADFKTLEKGIVRELKAAQKAGDKRKRRVGNRAPSGFVKPARISDELAGFLGKETGTEMSRTDVSKEINAYIVKHNLKNAQNGRIIHPDAKLTKLLKVQKDDELTFFNLQRYMKPHFAKAGDAVAATAGPGLIVCLSVGLSFGKAIACSLNKPFIAVNHLEGHALSPKINSKLNYPYLLLLISGGHTQFLNVRGLGKYKRLGTTIDDAVGEAFDKTAKLLGIEFPGGPQIEVYAKKGNPYKYLLPKPIFNKGGCNLSFAGLKTAVLKISKQIKTDQEKYDLAASFQKTIEEILFKKSKIAFEEFKQESELNENKFIVAGGVAANKKIREVLINLCNDEGFEPIFPPINLCGDNAAMIAMVGLEKFKLGQFSQLDHPAKPRWPLDEDAIFLKGAGVRL